jgi:hypothetical protein
MNSRAEMPAITKVGIVIARIVTAMATVFAIVRIVDRMTPAVTKSAFQNESRTV